MYLNYKDKHSFNCFYDSFSDNKNIKRKEHSNDINRLVDVITS